MSRIPKHVGTEKWDGVPLIEKFEVSSRGFVAQYTWTGTYPRFWCRTLYKSGKTYFRKGKL